MLKHILMIGSFFTFCAQNLHSMNNDEDQNFRKEAYVTHLNRLKAIIDPEKISRVKTQIDDNTEVEHILNVSRITRSHAGGKLIGGKLTYYRLPYAKPEDNHYLEVFDESEGLIQLKKKGKRYTRRFIQYNVQ